MTNITIKIRRTRVDQIVNHPLEVAIDIFEIKVETGTTTWPEIFGSRERVESFVRGVKAGAAAMGNYTVTEDWQEGSKE